MLKGSAPQPFQAYGASACLWSSCRRPLFPGTRFSWTPEMKPHFRTHHCSWHFQLNFSFRSQTQRQRVSRPVAELPQVGTSTVPADLDIVW